MTNKSQKTYMLFVFVLNSLMHFQQIISHLSTESLYAILRPTYDTADQNLISICKFDKSVFKIFQQKYGLKDIGILTMNEMG